MTIIRHLIRWIFINPWAIPLVCILIIGFWAIGDNNEVESLIDFLFDGLVIGQGLQR